MRRGDGDAALLFVINHTDQEETVPLLNPMTDLLSPNSSVGEAITLGSYGVAMLR